MFGLGIKKISKSKAIWLDLPLSQISNWLFEFEITEFLKIFKAFKTKTFQYALMFAWFALLKPAVEFNLILRTNC